MTLMVINFFDNLFILVVFVMNLSVLHQRETDSNSRGFVIKRMKSIIRNFLYFTIF